MTQGRPSADFGGELLSATVRRLVLDRIVRGHYQPGERIVEFKLAKELGVSQSPVREGLRELADVSLVRAEVDALAARLSAGRIPDATLDELEGLIDEMLARLEQRDFPGVTAADVRFHQLIAEASQNHALTRAFEQLAPFARTFITLTLPDVDVREIVLEHRPILEALRAHDADRAAEAARRHQLSVSELLIGHFPAGEAIEGADTPA